MKTIAQQLNVKKFPFTIKDIQGNTIYFEDANGYWVKREYDLRGNKIYYETSNGLIEDKRNIPEYTVEELITKQQLQIEKYKEMLKVNKELKSQIIGKFYSIGQPLNDNVLQMNQDQMKWCFEVVHLVEHLNYS